MHQSKLGLSFLATLALAFAGRSHAQTLTTLLSFNGTNGAVADGDLTLIGSTLYGTTVAGGPSGYGNIFSIPVTGGTPTTLFNFNLPNGAYPEGNLTLVGSTLYGTTSGGGANNDGNVFSIPVTGGTPTVLASFNGTNGQNPLGNLTLSADGSTFFGMTSFGGANDRGTVFSVPVTGGASTVLLSFSGTNGSNPQENSLTLSADGSTLYGMTLDGGANGDGTVFRIPVTGGTPTTLLSFNGTDGSGPYGSLTLSADGSTLYGMTARGGAFTYPGTGTVFSIPVTGGAPTTLLSFNGTDGENPYGSLTLSGSTLYGMASQGGANGDGTIFSIPVTGGAPTTLLSFNGTNGAHPLQDVTLNGSTLYGMTREGGAHNDGTVFAFVLPEPSSVVLLGFGAIILGVAAARRDMARRAA